MVLFILIGSIHAADDSQSDLTVEVDDDFDLDDDEDLDDSDDESLDDFDMDDDENLDDSDDEELDYEDFEESDYFRSYDYLEYKVMSYLERYGNCSEDNWTESESFLNEYQIYRANPSNYTLNKSAEGYNAYLKIFDSITSTFGDYNVTDDQTEYLKFLIIYYLNHYGNVSANYTWNESEGFANYTPPFDFLADAICKQIGGNATAVAYGDYSEIYFPGIVQLNNSTDVNQTYAAGQAGIEAQSSWELNIFVLILVLALMILIII